MGLQAKRNTMKKAILLLCLALSACSAVTEPAIVQDTVYIVGEQATGIATPFIPEQREVIFLGFAGRTFVVDGTGDQARYLQRYRRGEHVKLRYRQDGNTYRFLGATEVK